MRSGRCLIGIAFAAAACGGGSSSSSAPRNTMQITVNGSLCAAGSYPNKPCVAVSVCTPGSSSCQTVDDVLLDTGSFGLRVFRQALSLDLPQIASGGGSLAECVQFGDGTSLWGPVATASVVLGSEPAVEVPVQIVDASFATRPVECANADASPGAAGYTAILGVGVFAHDCGDACASAADNRSYFSCTGGSCAGAAVPLASQVQNPVGLLARDGNGVAIQLPPVPLAGAGPQVGTLLLGVGTEGNNAPSSSIATYATDGSGNFETTLGGNVGSGFLDTGSNGLFFTPPASSSIPPCPSNAEWFCPASPTSLSATNAGASGAPSSQVAFTIENFEALTGSSNECFPDIGGGSSGPSEFDWGLPFHYGRTVYVGLEARPSSLGTGPFFAY